MSIAKDMSKGTRFFWAIFKTFFSNPNYLILPFLTSLWATGLVWGLENTIGWSSIRTALRVGMDHGFANLSPVEWLGMIGWCLFFGAIISATLLALQQSLWYTSEYLFGAVQEQRLSSLPLFAACTFIVGSIIFFRWSLGFRNFSPLIVIVAVWIDMLFFKKRNTNNMLHYARKLKLSVVWQITVPILFAAFFVIFLLGSFWALTHIPRFIPKEYDYCSFVFLFTFWFGTLFCFWHIQIIALKSLSEGKAMQSFLMDLIRD
ncbi:hypothetical protein K2W90_02150 [Candidatus Babeliales bacterium]|nr:hypothetical protein [Candidatus Babeliales bacterium]